MMSKGIKSVIALGIVSAIVFTSPWGMISNAATAQNNGQKGKAAVQVIKEEIKELKSSVKETKLQMKEAMKNQYTLEEMDALKKVAKAITTENTDVTVIPVETIITKKNVKFDTPPVIKQGRTLIPVRALTEGFGATVEWNAEERIVTVSKGDVVIVFNLNDGKVLVNDEETAIDVPAQIMNNRTIVPLRFILERFKLKVEYDSETGIIEIDEEADESNTDDDEENTEAEDEDDTTPLNQDDPTEDEDSDTSIDGEI